MPIAQAKKPGGGGGGETAAYVTIDLLGFDNGDLGYQSQAWFVSERDATDGVAILGSAFERYPGFPEGPAYREEFPHSGTLMETAPSWNRSILVTLPAAI